MSDSNSVKEPSEILDAAGRPIVKMRPTHEEFRREPGNGSGRVFVWQTGGGRSVSPLTILLALPLIGAFLFLGLTVFAIVAAIAAVLSVIFLIRRLLARITR